MKKTVIKCVYIAAVFLLALFLSSIALNQGNTEMTMEMAPATYPIIRMFAGDREVNSLHGYKDSMETSFQRDCLTPLGEGRRVVFTVDKYGASVESLSFEVRSIDGSRLVESTKVSQYEETEETIRAEFAIKDLIEEIRNTCSFFCLRMAMEERFIIIRGLFRRRAIMQMRKLIMYLIFIKELLIRKLPKN